MTKLVKFRVHTPLGPFDRLGVVIDEKFVDLTLAYTAYLTDVAKEAVPYRVASALVPTDLLEFIEAGQPSIDAVRETIEYVTDKLYEGVRGPKGEKIVYDPQEVKLLPPLPSLKSRMFAIGRNFKKHVPPEMWPQRPSGFLKNTYSCIAHGDDIISPTLIAGTLNIEVELVAYIGKKGKNIPKGKAMDYIIGYTVGNDVTAREQQRLDVEDRRMIYFGKNADTFAPLGPYLVLKDEIPDPYALQMRATVNGKLYQEDVMSDIIFPYDEVIAYFSRDYTLYPGDLIWSGSVAYVDQTLDPLQPGDVVEVEVGKVGILRNQII